MDHQQRISKLHRNWIPLSMHALPIDSGDVGEMRDTGAVQGRRGEKLLRHVAVRVTVSEQQQPTLDGHRLTNKWTVLRPRPRPFKQQQDCRCTSHVDLIRLALFCHTLHNRNKMPRCRRDNHAMRVYMTSVLTPILPLTLSLSITYNNRHVSHY